LTANKPDSWILHHSPPGSSHHHDLLRDVYIEANVGPSTTATTKDSSSSHIQVTSRNIIARNNEELDAEFLLSLLGFQRLGHTNYLLLVPTYFIPTHHQPNLLSPIALDALDFKLDVLF
jgi:hypothetical protein